MSIEYSPNLVVPTDFTVDELDIIYSCCVLTASAHERAIEANPDCPEFCEDMRANVAQMKAVAARVKELLPFYDFEVDHNRQ